MGSPPPLPPASNADPRYRGPAAAAAPQTPALPAAPQQHHSMPAGSEHTGVCGTSFYISPEISNGWASYDAKVSCHYNPHPVANQPYVSERFGLDSMALMLMS